MYRAYLEYLVWEYKKAEYDYEVLKDSIIRDIDLLDIHQIDTNKDINSEKIMNLTNITSKLRTLEEIIRAFEKYEKYPPH